MTFWFSSDLGNFLFDGFAVQTTKAFVATCFGLASMAIFLEIFKFWRMEMKQRSVMCLSLNSGSESSGLLSGLRLRGNLERIVQIIGEVLLYFTQESFNWVVMLAIMGYNGYIFLSVLAGSGLGYALFGESIARARIHNLKMKAAMISCGECQVKNESEEDTAGRSDPPVDVLPIPSVSGFVSFPVTVHSDP